MRSLSVYCLVWVALTSGIGFQPRTPAFAEAAGPYPIQFGFSSPEVEFPVGDPERDGRTNGFVVIEKVVSYSADGLLDMVVLRNLGGKVFDLSGWKMTDKMGDQPYFFGDGIGCEEFSRIQPSEKLEVKMKTPENPCGFTFSMDTSDAINLLSPDERLVANVAWDQSYKGMVIQRGSDGKFKVLNERLDILAKLEALGNFSHFLNALNVTGLANKLVSSLDPEYDNTAFHAAITDAPPVIPQFPSWFGYVYDRSQAPAEELEPETPLKEGIPAEGPYTVFAPTDKAFEDLREALAAPGEEPVPMEFIMELPELSNILMYHIAGGIWDSNYLVNNTAVPTSIVAEIVPFTDGVMGEGSILLHDSCVDKPTPDGIECPVQRDYGKCFDPFMQSPLSAQWVGGFCQRTCERCSCDVMSGGSPCAKVVWPDIVARNGIVHSISRVLFPPPVFEAVQVENVLDDLASVVPKSKTPSKASSVQTETLALRAPSISKGTTG